MTAVKWEDLRDASFRGVHFWLVDTEGSSGRRAIPRAFPKKEAGWTEDNGAVLGQQQINARLIGADYQRQLEALLRALNLPGPGELVHPWFGIQKVQVGKVTHQLSTQEGGVATVSFEVTEAGERLFPASQENTRHTVLGGVDKVKAALENGDMFALLDGLGEMTDTWLDDIEKLVQTLPAMPSAITDWADRLGRVRGLTDTLIAIPATFIHEILDLTSDAGSAFTEPRWSVRLYEQLRSRWEGAKTQAGSANISRAQAAATRQLPQFMDVSEGDVETDELGFASSIMTGFLPPSEAMLDNVRDFTQVVTLATLLAQAQTLAQMTFRTGEEAISAGDALAGHLAAQAVIAVESGQRELWRALRDLRFAVVNDARVRSAKLPQIRRVSPSVTSPVALIAWRETGDTENRDIITQRNHLRDPSFILPGRIIEVID